MFASHHKVKWTHKSFESVAEFRCMFSRYSLCSFSIFLLLYLKSKCFPYLFILKHSRHKRLQVLMAVKIKTLVFWVVTPCRLVGRYQNFGGTYCLHLSPEDEGSMFFRNVGIYLQVHTALQPWRPTSILNPHDVRPSFTPIWNNHIPRIQLLLNIIPELLRKVMKNDQDIHYLNRGWTLGKATLASSLLVASPTTLVPTLNAGAFSRWQWVVYRH
jgi:hypothetical protein